MTNAVKERKIMEPPWREGDIFTVKDCDDCFTVLQVSDGKPSLVKDTSGISYGGGGLWRKWDISQFKRHIEPRDERIDDLVNDYHTDLGGEK